MPSNESIDYKLVLIAHIICADQQIHSDEAKALHELAEQVNANQQTIDETEKIFSQDKHLISVEDAAKKIKPNERSESIRQVLAIAYVDGFFSPLEREMVEKIADIFGCSQQLQDIIEAAEEFRANCVNDDGSENESSKLSLGAVILKGAESLLSRSIVQKLGQIAPENIGRKIEKLQREILLSGEEYDSAIKQCGDIAREDYQFSELSLNRTLQSLDKLKINIQKRLSVVQHQSSGKGTSSSAKEVFALLEETRKALTTEIIKEIELLRESLKAKQRALNHFSIAFMGKTKAGKSTLHAIVTGGGWEAIGVGKQRTTRYNRVYEWKNIRIIDTPGIGAPEDGGRTDEEVAQSVIDESDVICYVVTNDSIQETEFSFLKSLKEKTKPLIILLNVKNNLRDSRRLQHFLSDPDKPFTQEGKSSLKGHIERIRRYAQEHYANNYFDVIPSMLLAAQMSREPENEKIKDKLFEASRIKDFLDSIRVSLVEYGTIRRSQTLLGSTVGTVEKPHKWLTKEVQKYQEMLESLRINRRKVLGKVKLAEQDALLGLENQIGEVFQDVSNNAVTSFAKDNWKSDQPTMNKNWEKKLKDIRFSERIGNAYQKVGEEFKKEASEILEELGRELQLVADLSDGSFKFDKHDIDGSVKSYLKWGGIIAGIATGIMLFTPLAPFALAVGLIGSAMGIISNWFKSEDEKRREAAAKITSSLRSQLEIQQTQFAKKAKDDFSKSCRQTERDIDQYFEELIAGVEAITSELRTSQVQIQGTANYLNRAYAKRIIDYCLKQYNPLTDSGISQTIFKVERQFGQSINIQTKSNIKISKKLQEDLKRILQEDVTIQTVNTQSK
ncbi:MULTISPECIES: GTPase [Pseudanabaena]|uniref:GTPase n=1 Tax=Pseudanabaena TaxID=1152 RepID=UPI002479BB5A|nr:MULTISPECIES: GTPase [Pseudanabaena]MEA5489348.1 GTPase [Pseudanabaena sp. CCNP1317]WGS75299.1 50S ribosome-binding GTPase [Pseudanabaena galeata CCNP1313]